MKKWITLLLVLVGLVFILWGCGSSKESKESKEPDKDKPDKNTVLIRDFKFEPATITLQKGETVTWINEDRAAHTATGNQFDRGKIIKGESFTYTFNEPGTYDYICTYHPDMKGQVLVK